MKFVWNFGDNQKVEGIAVEHVFSKIGVYNVILTVTDKSGKKAPRDNNDS
jgi:PKD repeat protein